jgi:EF-hand domain pair/EF hand
MQRKLERKQSMLAFSGDDMKALFQQADLNHDGQLTKDELHVVFEKLNMNVNDKGLDALFTSLDKNNDGVVDVKEFMQGFSMLKKNPNLEKNLTQGRKSSLCNFCLEFDETVGIQLFKQMDKNQDGFITKVLDVFVSPFS